MCEAVADSEPGLSLSVKPLTGHPVTLDADRAMVAATPRTWCQGTPGQARGGHGMKHQQEPGSESSFIVTVQPTFLAHLSMESRAWGSPGTSGMG